MRPDVNHYDPAYNDSSIDWDQEEKKELAAAKAEIERLQFRIDELEEDNSALRSHHHDAELAFDGYEKLQTCVEELQDELEEYRLYKYQEDRHILMAHNVEQTLGRILGYPWYKDDKINFPDATEEDGVCVGEDTIETLADRAAERIQQLEDEVLSLRVERHEGWLSSDKLAEELKERDNRIADLTASRDEWRISAKDNAEVIATQRKRIVELEDQIAILFRQQRKLAVTVNNQTLRIAELERENVALKEALHA